MKRIFLILSITAALQSSCDVSDTNAKKDDLQNDKIEESEKYHTLGLELYDKGHYKEAIKNYDKAIELFNRHEVALLNRGNAKDELGDYEGSVKDYSRAIQIRPDMGMAYFNRALIKETKLQDSIGALEDYEMTIQVDPSYQGVFFNYGLLLHNLNRHKDAIKNFETHLKYYGQDDFAFFYIAKSYFALSDSKKGYNFLDKSISLGNPLAIDLKNKLAKPKLN